MGRGILSEKVKAKSKELLEYEIEKEELRLLPYIQYTMMNDQKIDPDKVFEGERKILRKWKDKKYIEGGASGLSITKEFWDIMNELLFISYVERAD